MKKNKTIPTSVRLKPSTKEQLEEIANVLNCSVSQLISATIEMGLAFVGSQIHKEGEKDELQ